MTMQTRLSKMKVKCLILILIMWGFAVYAQDELTAEELAMIKEATPVLQVPVAEVPESSAAEVLEPGETVSPIVAGTVLSSQYADSSLVQLDIPDVKEAIRFRRDSKFIKDVYTKQSDKSFKKSNKKWRQWKAIAKQTFNPIAYVPYTGKNLRMVAEMRTGYNSKHIKSELNYFKSNGYNGVLACWRGERTDRLIEMIRKVKAMGFVVWFTFGGRESVSEPVYISPDRYAQGLRKLSAVCDGFVVGWRRTSRHLFVPDKSFVGYTLKNVRRGNAEILVFGEIYYGYEPILRKHRAVTTNIPANISGVLVTNMGYRNSLPKGIIKLAKKYTQIPIIAVIVGETAYYMSINNNGKTKQENRKICHEIEKRFKDNGISNTITLAGDGSDGNYGPVGYDNLNKSNWHNK